MLDLILLVIDYAVLGHWQPYLERVVRMLFCLRAARFITIFKPMRYMVGCMLLTVRPVTSVILMSALRPQSDGSLDRLNPDRDVVPTASTAPYWHAASAACQVPTIWFAAWSSEGRSNSKVTMMCCLRSCGAVPHLRHHRTPHARRQVLVLQ